MHTSLNKHNILYVSFLSLSLALLAFAAAFASYTFLIFTEPDLSFVNSGRLSLPRVYVIESGSMAPAIKTASLVVAVPISEYLVGDIISFSRGKDNVVTHRIGAKSSDPQQVEYLTIGDANEDFDAGVVKDEQVVGKVVLILPYLGYMVDFAKRPQGFILFVIIPATIIVYEELKSLKREFGKRLQVVWPRFRKRRTTNAKISLKEEHGLSKAALVVPVLGSLAILIGFAGSYFFDIETVEGNSVSIEAPTPTPTTTPTPTP